MKNINLCFIISHLPQGGAERQLVLLLQNLVNRNYNVTLILYDNKEIFYKEIYKFPITIHTKTIHTNFKLVKYIGILLFLRKVLKNNKYDIIHTFLFHNGFLVRLIAPKYYRSRIVYSIRSSLEDYQKIFLFFEKLFIRRSMIVTNSKKSYDQFLGLVGRKYCKKIFVIYNGFDANKFVLLESRKMEKTIIIGTVGRMDKQKNQIQILKILNKIKHLHSIYFYLIGDKTQNGASDIINYVTDNNLMDFVTILDSQPLIEKYYQKFHIFILSSLYEGCPSVLFEALLSKCLCIISSGANSDSFIIDGKNGLVYDGSDTMLEEKLLFAIQLYYNGKAQEIINNGFDYAYKNFKEENMVNNYENLYSKLHKLNIF